MTEATASLTRPVSASDDVSAPVSGNPLASLYRLLVLCLVAAIVIVPLLATAVGGFKSLGELRVNAFGLPEVWVWKNYWDILVPAGLQEAAVWQDLSQWGSNLAMLAGHKYWQFLGNSLTIALLTVFLTLPSRRRRRSPSPTSNSLATGSSSTTWSSA